MKTETLVITGAAAISLYLIYRWTTPQTTSPFMYRTGGTKDNLNAGGTVQVPNTALPGQPGWGWVNYTDGTSIGPDGSYYMNGSKVWSAP